MRTKRRLITNWLTVAGACLVLTSTGCQSEEEERRERIAERLDEMAERVPEANRRAEERRQQRAAERCEQARADAERLGAAIVAGTDELTESSSIGDRVNYCNREIDQQGLVFELYPQCRDFLTAAVASVDRCPTGDEEPEE